MNLLDDDELTAEALAADPDAPIAADAKPFDAGSDDAAAGMLPQWYMPAPAARRGRRRAWVLVTVAASLTIGNVVGFCVTSGFPEFVWH
jgi:hypothetical protein